MEVCMPGKKAWGLCVFLFAGALVCADDVQATLEIRGVTVRGGQVYVAVYSTEADYKNERPLMTFQLAPERDFLTYEFKAPEGEYVVSLFQDTNNNGKLDVGIFGIPKEPVGITNWNGKGRPGGFHTLKVPVNTDSAKITVNLGKV
jgi:uncharacterized protein (DUF2141 family)